MMKDFKCTVLILFTCLLITGCEDILDMPQPMDAKDATTKSLSTLDASLNGPNYVKNIFEALNNLNPYIKEFHFSNGPASTEKLISKEHTQGIAYWNGYYYITRNRPSSNDNQQLLILDEKASKIITTLNLDTSSSHPCGIQIYNGILAVTFDNPNMLKLYDLNKKPTQPELKVKLSDTGGVCAGITEYNNNYLVTTYTGRDGIIVFRLFDKSFNLIKEKTWSAASQDKSNWFPYKTWQDKSGKNGYENMGLIKEQGGFSSTPKYYLIMYYTDPDRLDIFSVNISDSNLTNLSMNMIASKEVENPGGGGFRMGSGFAITDNNERIRVFSTIKRIHSSYSNNIIYQYNPYPWGSPIQFETGIQVAISIDDYGNCLSLHRKSNNEIYYKVGKVNTLNGLSWGNSYELKDTKVKSWGEHISVSLNNNGYCIATHRSGKNFYYRVGKINTNNKTVDWGGENKYDTGGDMSVAINNHNQVIEVHQGWSGGAHKKNHYYSVGTINTASKTITWKKKGTKFDTGGSIAIALDDKGNCLNIHLGSQSSITHRDNRYYRKGTVNFTNGIVSWGNSILYDTGGIGDIAISNNGQCVEVHRGSPFSLSHGNNHYYKTGTFSFISNNFNWIEEAQFQTGGGLSCTLNNNGKGICAFEKNGKLYYRIFK